MTIKTEELQSLRNLLEQKKKSFKIEDSLLELKGLRKFAHLEEYVYPQKLGKQLCSDFRNGLHSSAYLFKEVGLKHQHVFDKLITVIEREVRERLEFDISNQLVDVQIERLNAKFQQWGLTNVSLVPLDEAEILFVGFILKEKGNLASTSMVRINIESDEMMSAHAYSVLDEKLPKRVCKTFVGRSGDWRGKEARILPLYRFVAQCRVYELVRIFLESPTQRDLIWSTISNQVALEREQFDGVLNTYWLTLAAKDFSAVPTLVQSIVVLTFEKMLQAVVDIQTIESGIKAQQGDYATSFITKKHIPAKTREFMEKTRFLNYFGFVEADEDCQLEKLYLLEEEFLRLAKVIPFQQVKNHALRFRRLGKLKVGGAYFPLYRTLAVDIDSMKSFVHEWFHLVDYTHDLLSLTETFRPLHEAYCRSLNHSISQLDERDPILSKWNGSSKYNAAYYLSRTETFARLGELYVMRVLNIESNLIKPQEVIDGLYAVLYPTDDALLTLITPYFQSLFRELETEKISRKVEVTSCFN